MIMNEKIDKVHKFLEEHGIEYETHYHPPLPTIELAPDILAVLPDDTFLKEFHLPKGSMQHVDMETGDKIWKTLKPKGNRHYLVIFECHKELDIHSLEKSLHQGKLSFASAERMERCLGLQPGSVSLFGLIQDMNLVEHGADGSIVSIKDGVIQKELFENGHRVKLYLDADLKDADRLSWHPCDNTASTVISNADFHKFLKIWGGEVEWLEIEK